MGVLKLFVKIGKIEIMNVMRAIFGDYIDYINNVLAFDNLIFCVRLNVDQALCTI